MPAAIQAALGTLSSISTSTSSTVAAVGVPGATQTGNLVTITTTAAHGFNTGQLVNVSGVGTGYNGTFVIVSVPTATSFTYASPTTGLANAGGGTATVAISNAVVTQSASPFTITFQGTLGGANVPQIIANGSNLTGAGVSNPTVAVATSTAGVSSIILNNGGTLTLDNSTAGNNTNRLADIAGLTLNGGTLNFLGNGSAASSETIGALFLNSGNSTINSSNGTGQSAALTFTSLSRNPGATVNFTAGAGQTLGTASNQVLFTDAPTLTGNIIKGGTTQDNNTNVTVGGSAFTNSSGFNLATYGANGITALTTYQTLLSSGNLSTDNVLVSSSTALTAADTVNAALLVGNGIVISGRPRRHQRGADADLRRRHLGRQFHPGVQRHADREHRLERHTRHDGR